MRRLLLLCAVALVALAAFLAAACGDDDDATPTPTKGAASQTATNAPASATANSTNGTSVLQNATTTPSGLKYVDTVVGTGRAAKKCDKVTVAYVGKFTNGKVFDSSNDGIAFVLGAGQVIQGWDEGLTGMKVGGKRTLDIPANLAYGTRGKGAIPPNTELVFDVQLKDATPSGTVC